MSRRHDPDSVAPAFSAYSQAIEVPADARWLHVSGQVGVTPDGALAEGVEAQIEQAWRNVLAILASAGMSAADLVKVTVYLTGPEGVPAYREIRDRMLGGVRSASTLVLVAGLANPDWLVEIDAIAAEAD